MVYRGIKYFLNFCSKTECGYTLESLQQGRSNIPAIILEGAMGKNALLFSKWPLNLESMGHFYNVRR